MFEHTKKLERSKTKIVGDTSLNNLQLVDTLISPTVFFSYIQLDPSIGNHILNYA
jgi:hypothetical protein